MEFPLSQVTNSAFNPAVSSIELIASPTSDLWPLQSASYRIGGVSVTRSVSQDTAAQAWRRHHFGDILPIGDAAETADPDGDGAKNLLEFALGTIPTQPASAPVLESGIHEEKLRLTFTPATTSGLLFGIETSTNLSHWSKTDITSLLTPGQPYTHIHAIPVEEGDRSFLRLEVIRK